MITIAGGIILAVLFFVCAVSARTSTLLHLGGGVDFRWRIGHAYLADAP